MAWINPVQTEAEAGSKTDLAQDLLSQHLHSCSWWKEKNAVWPLSPFSYSHLGTLLSLLIRGNNYQSGQVIKLKHKWLHELGWLYYKVFPGLIKEKYGSAHPRCHRAGEKEEKKKLLPLTWITQTDPLKRGILDWQKKRRERVCKILPRCSFLSASVPQAALFVCVWE